MQNSAIINKKGFIMKKSDFDVEVEYLNSYDKKKSFNPLLTFIVYSGALYFFITVILGIK